MSILISRAGLLAVLALAGTFASPARAGDRDPVWVPTFGGLPGVAGAGCKP